MKNNIKYFLYCIVWCLIFITWPKAGEQFTFDVTEIQISNDGNQINGYKGGTVHTEDGDKIIADEFSYNKITNILEAVGSVKFTNKSNDTIIFSEKAIYLKNKEKIFTKGNSKAINQKNIITAHEFDYNKIENILKAKKNVEIIDIEKDIKIYADDITYLKNKEKIFTIGKTSAQIEKKYDFVSSDVSYLRNTSKMYSKQKTLIKDRTGNYYELDEFNYSIIKKLLKGKNLKVLAKVDKNKTDEYFFSEGFFNLDNKKYISKETKIKVHKDIFNNKDNDPRLYGSSSFGDDKKTTVNNGIFTSCKINDKRTSWCIKSKKITHDKIKKNLIYENAILKVYDIPVMYFPKFFHPDPTVKRRSGFLQPQFNNSKILGSSLYIPYFKTFEHDEDYTFKPTIFENNKYILQNEFRKEYKDASLITDFSLTRGYKSPNDDNEKSISHFFLNYNKDLKLPNFLDSNIELKIEKVTNDTYLKVFQNNLFVTPVMPDDRDLMESKLHLELDSENYIFSSGMQVYENLTGKNSDRFQYIFPYYNFTKSLADENFIGSVNFSSSGSNKLINTNNLKTTILNGIDYNSINYISQKGFANNFGIYFKNSNTIAKNDATYSSSPQIDAFSIFNMESSFPLSKIKDSTNRFLTPKISFRINPGNNMKNHANTNKIITADNAFNINRLGISDSYEAGKSLTLGIDYKIDNVESFSSENTDIKDKYLEFKLATVIRDKEESDIPVSSTINKKSSNIFGSINNNLLDNINLGYDFSVNNNMKTVDSHSFDTELSINNFVTTFNFIEQRGDIGTTHMLSNTTEYKIDDNNFIKFSTRRNKSINLTEYYDLSYEYKNDCLIAALKFNKVFYQDNDLKPSEDLFFTITLIPLTTYEREIYKSR
jgi:LPS-assembly protein